MQVPPCYITVLERFMAVFEGREASALQLLGPVSVLQTQGLRVHPQQNDQKEKQQETKFL